MWDVSQVEDKMSNDSYTYFSDESGVIPSTPDDQYRS